MQIIYMIWILILGAIMGSFLSCMGYRIPNKIKATYPSSFCSSCKKPLKWYMNIPIVSYIVLRGRCKYCNKKIGFIYFFCEVLCMILFGINYYLFKFDLNFFLSSILTCLLIVTIVTDFLYYYISDRVLIISYVLILLVLFIFLSPTIVFQRIGISVLAFIFMYLLKLLGNSLFNQESLGDGDIKLMCVLSLALGLINTFICLFFASVLGLIYSFVALKKTKEGLIPFGPFLIIGALMVIYLSNILDPLIKEFLF